MANYDTERVNAQARSGTGTVAIDEGLRSYMLSIYNYMGLGLILTGIVAYLVFQLAITTNQADAAGRLGNGTMLTPFGVAIYTSWLKWVLALSPLAIVFLFAARINSMSTSTAQMVFFLFSALMGASISSIFVVYTQASIAQIFFITAATFGALSLWGYTTKKDLSGWGSFLFMGMIGIIIAALVNLFVQSSALQFAVSVITVLVFSGLTAYDTQRLKDQYYSYANYGGEALGRAAIMGALSLYLDFINMFMALLSLFGNRE
jgi:FtsH-binding integral membrane protein